MDGQGRDRYRCCAIAIGIALLQQVAVTSLKYTPPNFAQKKVQCTSLEANDNFEKRN